MIQLAMSPIKSGQWLVIMGGLPNQTKLLAHMRSLKRPSATYVSEITRNDLNDVKKLLENETRSNKTVSLIVVPSNELSLCKMLTE